MPKSKPDAEKQDILDLFIPWGLVLLSAGTTWGALSRMFAAEQDLLKRIDSTTLLYLVVAGALLLFRQIKTLAFGDVKLELLEKVKERQAKQEEKLDNFDLILPLLLPETERKHLQNLAEGKTKNYEGNKSLREELRRLRSIKLISMKNGFIGDIKDRLTVDLANHVELTKLGWRWYRLIADIEEPGKQDPAAPDP
jgi:hypothetical protein